MIAFLIPKVEEFEPREDIVNALLESIAYHHWLSNCDEYKVFSMTLKEVQECVDKEIPLEENMRILYPSRSPI